jgi:hypothetical protein
MSALPMPPAVTEFLSARAAAAASLLVARQTVRRHDVASHVLHEAVGHAGRVCALLLRDGHPAEAMVYALAAGMLDERATKARAHTMRTLAVLRGAA